MDSINYQKLQGKTEKAIRLIFFSGNVNIPHFFPNLSEWMSERSFRKIAKLSSVLSINYSITNSIAGNEGAITNKSTIHDT